MSKSKLIYIFIIYIFLGACNSEKPHGFILIKGGTAIHTCNTNELKLVENSYVLIKDEKIVKTGIYFDTVSLPKKYKTVDASGKYLVPGLIDGFAAINNQAYANANLLSGVTSIIGVSSTRRGDLFLGGNPSPNIYKIGEVGDEYQSDEEIIADFDQSYKDGVRVMLLMYKLDSNQLKLSLDLCKKYNMADIGELGFTSYKKACELGVSSFVHTTRYSLDIAQKDLRREVAENPFSNDLGSPKWRYYQLLTHLDTSDEKLIDHSKILANSESYIMPTLSLLYLDLPEHKNPWNYEISKLIDEKDINNPADKTTGNHTYTKDVQQAYTELAIQELKIEKVYASAGAKYIAGSATDVWGTMPGISLHTELELFERIGLSPEQILATCTSNFSEAFNWDIGKISAGFKADLLILNNNPIENIENLKNIHMLFLNGKKIDLEKLYEVEKNNNSKELISSRMKKIDRRKFLKTNSLALAGIPLISTISLNKENKDENSFNKKIKFTRDGLDFDPDEYSNLLAELTKNKKNIIDNYSRFGVVEELENKFAKLLGKESAVFMPTGTLANHIAVKILAGNKKRVLVQNVSHLYNDSGDCAQKLSGLNLIPLGNSETTFTLEQVKNAINRTDQGRVKTGIGAIMIESPVRRKDNEMFDFEEMKSISEYAKTKGIKMHLDGARLFNAVAHSNHSLTNFTSLFDTVYVSLYKNFNAASGAILAGSAEQLKDLYHMRRMFGGGMPQVWPFAIIASHYADSFLADYKKALSNFEILKQELEESSKFKIGKIENGTNVFILKLLSGDAKTLQENLMIQNIILPNPNDNNSFKIKTNTSLLRIDAKLLAEKFIKALI